MVKKLKFLIGAIIICLIGIMVCLTGVTLLREKAINARIAEVSSNIIANVLISQEVSGGISKTWGDAIKNSDDFDAKIMEFLHSETILLQFEEMKATDKTIKEGLQKLKNYPAKYKEVHKELMDLYAVYSQLYSFAFAPSGSMFSYSNKVNDLSSEFIKIESRLEIYVPELKNQAAKVLLDKMDVMKTKMESRINEEFRKAEEARRLTEERTMEAARRAEEERLEKEREEKIAAGNIEKMQKKVAEQIKSALRSYESGDEKMASDLYNEVLKSNPTLPRDMYLYIGNVYYSSKKYEKAIKPYKKALDLNKKDFITYRKLAEICKLLKRYDEAVGFYKAAVEIEPDKNTYDDLAELYITLKRYDDAIGVYKDALEASSDNGYFYEKLGIFYSSLDRHDDAITVFKKAISACGYDNSFKFHNYLGNSYYSKQQYFEAIGEYVAALFGSQNNAEYNFNLGRAQLAYGDYGKAIWYLESAAKNGKVNADLYYYLGKAYKGCKDYAKAEECFSKAIQLCQNQELKIEIKKALQDVQNSR